MTEWSKASLKRILEDVHNRMLGLASELTRHVMVSGEATYHDDDLYWNNTRVFSSVLLANRKTWYDT